MKRVSPKVVVLATLMSLSFWSGMARAGGTSDDPDYAWAWMEGDKIRLRTVKPVYETVMETKTAIVDGQAREYAVCRTVSKLVSVEMVEDGSGLDIFAVGAGAVAPKRWAGLLKKPTIVLTTADGRDLPAYYQTIFKPGTLVVAMRPIVAAPMPATAFAPSNDPPPPPPAPTEASVVDASAPAAPAPPPAPPAPSGPSLPMPQGPAPLLTFASLIAKDQVRLRHVAEQETTDMVTVTVTRAGEPATEETPIKATVKQSVTKELSARHVKLFVDGTQAFRSRVAGLLARETLTLASRDGQPVGEFYTRLLKPGAIVLVAPVAATAGMACSPTICAPAPMAAPAPFAPAPPPPAPVEVR